MKNRDLKIGLIAGLVIVVIVVVKLSINPDGSNDSGMMQLNATTNVGEDSFSSNDIYEENLTYNEVSFNPESSDLLSNQDEQLQDIFSNIESEQPSIQQETLEIVSDNTVENEQEEIFETVSVDTTVASETIEQPAIETVIEQVETTVSPDSENAAPIKAEKSHVVLEGQTLSEISRIYYGSSNQWKKIVDANPEVIKDPDIIKPGMKIIIPD